VYDDKSFVFNNDSKSIYLYKSQMSIIRYHLRLAEPEKNFEISLSVESSLPPDTFEIKKFFLTNIGYNLPCAWEKEVTYTKGFVFYFL
jgi:hypothetical protein